MRTEFIGFPEAQDQSATMMCYLMELSMNHGIITNVPEVLAENIGKSILTVLINPVELDPKEDKRLQKYTAMQISNIIVWSFECVQIVEEEFSDAELHPALRTLVESRYSLQPYTAEGKKKTSQNANKRTMELLMNRLVEAAKRSTITVADEITRAQFEVRVCRDILASSVGTLKGLEEKRDKLFDMFNGRSKELEEAQLQRAASAKLNEIRALFESGSVVDIKMLAETLEVTTKPIFLEYPEGSRKKKSTPARHGSGRPRCETNSQIPRVKYARAHRLGERPDNSLRMSDSSCPRSASVASSSGLRDDWK